MAATDEWTARQEALLVEWSVKASGLRWLHTEAAGFYSIVADCITIPTIVISTGAGITALKETCGGTLSIAVGCLNLLAAFIISMNRYYTPSDKARDHKAAASDYSKLFRRIQAELSMEVGHRTRCLEFVTACRAEYDRLVSQGAPIPGFVIARYKRQFAEVHHKPEIVNVAVEELGRGPEEGGVSRAHEAAVAHPTRTVFGRTRRPSTVLQDHLIDPGTAMRQAGPQIVVDNLEVSGAEGPPPGMRRAAPLPGAPVPSSPDFETDRRPRRPSGLLPPARR